MKKSFPLPPGPHPFSKKAAYFEAAIFFSQDEKVFDLRQAAGTARGVDIDHVFEADPAPLGVVEPGLHGDDDAGFEGAAPAGVGRLRRRELRVGQPGGFVDVKTHAMAEGVEETVVALLPVSGVKPVFFQHPGGFVVDGKGDDARGEPSFCRFPGVEDGVP